TGTHIGNLWTAEGVNLASATFSGESESGWQQVDFIVPVPIEANTTYVASYFAPSGNYAATGQGLAEGRDNAPLHALSDGVNGVYVYGPSSAFPVNTFNATNYWVDVVFDCNSTVLNSPLSMSGVNLYPNPANREIRVAMRQTMAKGSIVRVYDSRGIEVLNQEITGEENTLDVSGFLPGLYVLKVYDADGMISSRLFFVRH